MQRISYWLAYYSYAKIRLSQATEEVKLLKMILLPASSTNNLEGGCEVYILCCVGRVVEARLDLSPGLKFIVVMLRACGQPQLVVWVVLLINFLILNFTFVLVWSSPDFTWCATRGAVVLLRVFLRIYHFVLLLVDLKANRYTLSECQ